MKGSKFGFTLVEVSLFLGVTALLFFGVTLGVRGSIFQQRYNDSVQNFADFLRTIYSETMNVEHGGTGRSDRAIYGKLVTFGETYGLDGSKITDGETHIFSYTVVGHVGGLGFGDALSSLKNLSANVAIEKGSTFSLAGVAEEYVTRWGAEIQTTAGYSSGYKPFTGSILIVRHPQSGTVNTYYYASTIQVNKTLATGTDTAKRNLLSGKLSSSNFKQEGIDFCVNPLGKTKSDARRNIRLVANARNASAVEIINQDDSENRCKK